VNNMSSKLFAGGTDEASRLTPMPWSTSSSPEPRLQSQAFLAGPKPGAPGSQDEVKVAFAQVEQRIAEAREAGRKEGEIQGRRAAQAEMESALQRIAAAIQEVSELRGRLRTQAEADLVRLAIAIARKVVGREITADPEAITGLVKAALEKVRTQEVLRVRVHPAHNGPIADCLSKYGATRVEVVADPNSALGTVILETTRGSFDASVETQLREIERGLTDRFNGKG
jgi:flagellar assembly protein FliH